ncbi:MAG: magnesium-translocating P-type ATPase, partial [Lachnospiraceae bacterium]
WDASSIGGFMLWFGPVSSLFDWLTYLILYFVICPAFVSGGTLYHAIGNGSIVAGGALAGMEMKTAYMAMFQAGWFVESMWSQTLAVYLLRTPQLPFLQSRPSAVVTLVTGIGIAVVTFLPMSAAGAALGFVALPGIFYLYLAVILILYILLITGVKRFYIRRYNELL